MPELIQWSRQKTTKKSITEEEDSNGKENKWNPGRNENKILWNEEKKCSFDILVDCSQSYPIKEKSVAFLFT